ncbi:hypothetical protein D9M72_282760 [compost metagenome]
MRELPQRQRVLGIRDVQCVVAAATLVEATDQDGFPRGAHLDVSDDRGPVHQVEVSGFVARVGEAVHVGHHGGGDVRPSLAAAIGGSRRERMEHAVVGCRVDHGLARTLSGHEGGIAGVGVVEGRLAHVHGRAVDDVAEHGCACPINCARRAVRRARTLERSVAAQEVHEVRTVVGNGGFRSRQATALRRRHGLGAQTAEVSIQPVGLQARPIERSQGGGGRRLAVEDAPCGVGPRLEQRLRRPHGRAANGRGVAVERVGLNVADPSLRGVACLVDLVVLPCNEFQRAGGSGRRRAMLFLDGVHHTCDRFAQRRGVQGRVVLAASVDCCMPQVIDVPRIA